MITEFLCKGAGGSRVREDDCAYSWGDEFLCYADGEEFRGVFGGVCASDFVWDADGDDLPFHPCFVCVEGVVVGVVDGAQDYCGGADGGFVRGAIVLAAICGYD